MKLKIGTNVPGSTGSKEIMIFFQKFEPTAPGSISILDAKYALNKFR